MKVFLIILGILVVLIGGVAFFFVDRISNMEPNLNAQFAKVTNVDLSLFDDGVYKGSVSEFPIVVDLEVEIKEHKIVEVRILNQLSGKGYDAKGILPRFAEKQAVLVDAFTGASYSSKGIMIAVSRALSK